MPERRSEYLKLNRNMLIAFAASITASAAFAQLMSGQEDHMNATYTLAVDHLVYLSTFGGLYCLSHRGDYAMADGRLDGAALRRDVLKIIASLGVSEAVYTAVRWLAQYYFLTWGHDPYAASIMSQSISIMVYVAAMNISVKIARLYRDGG